MKAQILKIAGVKTEAEFYKKFPTEEAFMKKHGKELKKAQYGTYVAGQQEQPEQQPIAYSDLEQDTMARLTGISKEEKARQEGLAALKAGKAGDSDSPQGKGVGDILSGIDPKMLAGLFAKNGKKMKKAQEGLNQGFFGDTTSNYGYDANSADGFQNAISSMAGKSSGGNSSTGTPFDWKGLAGKVAGQIPTIVAGIQQIDQNKKDITKTRQWADISEIGAQAALSRTEQSKRRYVRPEDNLVTGMNPLGKKDSLLAAQNGAEIANTFAPNTIYTDMGYEPLNDSNIKQYKKGGKLKKAQGGINLDPFAGIAGGIGGALGSAAGKGTGKGGPAASIGSAVGGIAGSFIPIPGVGTALGSLAGGFIGGLFDSGDQNRLQEAQDRQQAAITQATIGKGASNLQQANKAFMENGGYMNPEYNPQVIAKFGDYTLDQLLAPPNDADMLRAGGHLKEYTPPSAAAMYTGRDLPFQMEDGGQMAMGGDLQVHRGEAETLSYNPFLPDGGETIMFRGPSHDNGGMPISFGENGVEVEGGEPAVKLQDGGSPDGSLVVYGNMVIPEYGVAELGDEKAKGKKFKNYVDDLSKIEAKQNKLIDTTTSMIDNIDGDGPFEQLSLNTGQANLIGTTMKLKEIADKKKTAAMVQNAILDTASEMGLESDALAKGKIKYAKANDPYAEFGAKLEEFKGGGKKGKKKAAKPTMITTPSKDVSTLQGFVKNIPYKERKAMAEAIGMKDFAGTAEQNDFLLKKTQYSDAAPLISPISATNTGFKGITPTDPKLAAKLPIQLAQQAMDKSIKSGAYKTGNEYKLPAEQNNWWETGLNAVASALPFVRPSNQIPLDPAQLSGEMYALSQNAEDPVFAQSYQPLLTQPISISLQDQLNEVTSQARAAERMAQGNPAALAMIAAQASDAKNKILGEQFRMNQAEAQRVGETNRQTINQAMQTNLGLYDQQQQRAAQARSNTKLQAITALNSISDKMAKQKLENRQMAISENLYNYRFTPNGVAYNINPLANFAPYGSGAMGKAAAPEGYEYETILKKKKTSKSDDTETSRNGSIVKAIKGL